jgi:hypothetical protein
MYSKRMRLIPVLPKLILTGGHNSGIPGFLHDYVDVPEYFIHEIPENTRKDDITVYTFAFEELIVGIPNVIRTNFPFKSIYQNIAKNVVSKISRPLACVRVRRTDMLHCNPKSVDASSISNIKNVLSRHTYENVYIMTDEKDRTYFNDIQCKLQYFDFLELKDIKDNYALFCIENVIQYLSDIRISMFTINETGYYHDYLCDSFGFH